MSLDRVESVILLWDRLESRLAITSMVHAFSTGGSDLALALKLIVTGGSTWRWSLDRPRTASGGWHPELIG